MFALWVRFGSGGIEKIDGVMILDIRDALRGEVTPGKWTQGFMLRVRV